MCNNINELQFDVVKNVGGDRGASMVDDVIEPVVYALVEPEFLARVSWTGRGKPNEKKIALSQYVNITNFITLTINKASGTTQTEIIRLLKYKVLKYAAARATSSSNSGYSGLSDESITSRTRYFTLHI